MTSEKGTMNYIPNQEPEWKISSIEYEWGDKVFRIQDSVQVGWQESIPSS